MHDAIVMTTINVPHNLVAWKNDVGDREVKTYVVGDLRSPHEDIVALLSTLPGDNIYIHPDDQDTWASSSAIGWNAIQRRNLGLLHAVQDGAEIIAEVDDDNFPITDGYWQTTRSLMYDDHKYRMLLGSGAQFFNPGMLFDPPVMHRGFPQSLWNAAAPVAIAPDFPTVGVVASLWVGDTDTDAITRIYDGGVRHVLRELGRTGVVWDIGTWAPFNSQATAFRSILASAMYCWPGVGRYDDIWASYLARKIMDQFDLHVHYGPPLIYQQRNPHSYIHDLKEEMHGLQNTESLIALLRSWDPVGETVADMVNEFWNLVSTAHDDVQEIIPESTVIAGLAWCKDLRTIGILKED